MNRSAKTGAPPICAAERRRGWSDRHGAARIKRNMQAVVNQWTESQSCERLWLITGQNIPCNFHTRWHGLCPQSVTIRGSEIPILIIGQGSQYGCVLCSHTCRRDPVRQLTFIWPLPSPPLIATQAFGNGDKGKKQDPLARRC